MSCVQALQRLVGAGDRPPRLLVVGAHPDDETIGAGALITQVPDVWVAIVTDGSPRAPGDARAAGFPDRAAYAEARRQEAEAALAVAGVPAQRLLALEFVDQDLVHELVPATWRLAQVITDLRPEVVLTHAYEGGHPDHDATAFAVHAALALCRPRVRRLPALVEFGLYHERGGQLRRLELLPGAGAAVTSRLDPDEQARKRAMIASYATQAHVLAAFPTDVERYRLAAPMVFTRPPHDGPLHYERQPWGISGEGWRQLAAYALSTLGLDEQPESTQAPPP